jgi:hypothetical protein
MGSSTFRFDLLFPRLVMPKTFDLGQIQVTGSSGLDALFEREPGIVTPSKSRMRVASIGGLANFRRVNAETLIHKSDQDLWSVKREGNGALVIERMFSDDGTPLKG